MVSSTNVDLGKSDCEIFNYDQKLLAESYVFIADLSQPSTGTGFMAASAVISNKPVLCLFENGQKPSAMIAGCSDITTAFYSDDNDFKEKVRMFLSEHTEKFSRLNFKAPLELHLGFDFPKCSDGLPISLDKLMEECSKVGMVNGGWFFSRMRRILHIVPTNSFLVLKKRLKIF